MPGSVKPNVIIFGGLNTWSRTLAELLVPLDGETLVSNLRIVDKFSVYPPTTYLGTQFPKILQKPNVEYKQANLTVADTVSNIFDPPEGQDAYSYVFDLTGEVRHDRTDPIQVRQTVNVARLIGEEAARRGVKAYVRVTHPFYETPEKGSHDEKESIKPSGVRGVWWHEALRVLANIENLNLAILRVGLVYGPYVDFGVLTSTMTVASVYGYLDKPFKVLWSPGKNPMNTVHVVDVARASWALAVWIAATGRKQANVIAGEKIPSNDKGKLTAATSDDIVDPTKPLVAPLFNLVDDSKNTLASIGQRLASLFGTTFGFHGFVTDTMAKLSKLSESTIEDINEDHVGAWTEMLMSSNPPIHQTPLSAYMDESTLLKMTIAFNADKIKNIVGYKLAYPEFSEGNLRDIVTAWKAEGIWPNADRKQAA